MACKALLTDTSSLLDLPRYLLVVPRKVREKLRDVAAAASPREACGLLLVRGGVAEDVYVAENAAQDDRRFRLRLTDKPDWPEGPDLEVAVWHSHPGRSTAPSLQDVLGAHGTGNVHLIVAAATGTISAWRFSGDRPEPVQIVLPRA